MAYLFLAAAIALEVVGTSLLPSTNGFSRLWPSVACLASYAGAFVMLSQTVPEIPIGLTYAMWSGLGTAAIVAIGVVVLDESITVTKVVGVLLVIGGIVLLNLGGAH
ncbi:MAG: DMT family transporter [Nocardioidaceae bacterium]